SLTSGYESILDVLSALLPGYTLRWHYRSQDERLIGFSNAWVYDRSLVTFPGTTGTDRVRHVHVEQAAGDKQAADSVTAEVERVVALALEHAAGPPADDAGQLVPVGRHGPRPGRRRRGAAAAGVPAVRRVRRYEPRHHHTGQAEARRVRDRRARPAAGGRHPGDRAVRCGRLLRG